MGARIEVEAKKSYLDQNGAALPMADDQFTFVIEQSMANNERVVIATGTNNSKGEIRYSGRIPFSDDGTYTYYIREKAGSDYAVKYDTAEYRMTVKVERSTTGTLDGFEKITTYQCVVDEIKVEKWDETRRQWVTFINAFNPEDSQNSAIHLQIGDDTFVNHAQEGNIDISVKKEWNCDDGDVLSEVRVQLFRNGSALGEAISLSAKNNWFYRWEDQPITDRSGNVYEYTVEEVVPDEFIADYEYETTSEGLAATITNSKKTYQLHLTKVSESDPGLRLPGAVFQLLDSEGSLLSFMETSEGNYLLADNAMEGVSGSITTDENGELTLSGLTSGEYTLMEQYAPAGYAAAGPWEVTLGEDAENMVNGVLQVEIANARINYILPDTGGEGRTLLYFIGALMLLLAVAGLLKFRTGQS